MILQVEKHNPNQPQSPYHIYRILFCGGSGKKTNALINLVSLQPDIDKMYLHAKDPNETMNQMLIIKCEGVDPKHYNGSKTFVEYSNNMDYI